MWLCAFQFRAVVYARLVPTRYFWPAAYDGATAEVNGKQLTGTEFRGRCRALQRGFENPSPSHVIDMPRVEQKRASEKEASK
jgi:hypothetical protein